MIKITRKAIKDKEGKINIFVGDYKITETLFIDILKRFKERERPTT